MCNELVICDKNNFFQVEECDECIFDQHVPEVKRVTLSLTLKSKCASKFKYSVGHDLIWSGEGKTIEQ